MYLDPKVQLTKNGTDDPKKSGILLNWAKDRLVPDIGVIAMQEGKPLISKDEDGDSNIALLSPNPSAKRASLILPKGATGVAAVPYDAASHGRDYWLSPGVPIVQTAMQRRLLKARAALPSRSINRVNTVRCAIQKVMQALLVRAVTNPSMVCIRLRRQ